MDDHASEKNKRSAAALAGATELELEGPEKILRVRGVVAKVGVSRSTIYNKLNPKSRAYDPMFPRQVPLGIRSVGWIESEIDDWLARQANLRH